ncbi:MAG: hypothetical protein ACOCRO_00740 [Halanaerobiales bacterium]
MEKETYVKYIDLFYTDPIYHRIVDLMFHNDDSYDDLGKFINDKGDVALFKAYENKTQEVKRLTFEKFKAKRFETIRSKGYFICKDDNQ